MHCVLKQTTFTFALVLVARVFAPLLYVLYFWDMCACFAHCTLLPHLLTYFASAFYTLIYENIFVRIKWTYVF